MRPPSLVKALYVKFGHIGSRLVHGVQTRPSAGRAPLPGNGDTIKLPTAGAAIQQTQYTLIYSYGPDCPMGLDELSSS